MKRKQISKLILFIFLGLIGVYFFLHFHANNLRCAFIGLSNQFTVSKLGNVTVYSSIDTPKDTIQLLHNTIQGGMKKNEIFWEKKLSKAVVVYCHNSTQYNKYGHKGVPALTRLGTYIVVPSTGLEKEIFSHEFCHTELFNLLGRNWWVYYQRLPSWFDEGLALQFNNHGIYSPNSLASIKRMSIEELRKIDRPKNFYVKDYKQFLYHYCASKLELRTWLDKHNKEELLHVVKAIKDGKDFYKTYSNPVQR